MAEDCISLILCQCPFQAPADLDASVFSVGFESISITRVNAFRVRYPDDTYALFSIGWRHSAESMAQDDCKLIPFSQ